MTRLSFARASLVALGLAVSLPLGTRAQQQTDDREALQKRIDALEAGQQAILRELQAIKALLAARPAPTPPAVAAAALPLTPVAIGGSAMRGSENAKVTLVEFSDFECPFCGRYTRETYAQIQREYVDTGKVRYVFRHLPLENAHPQAFGAAVAAECAGAQNKFWEMHDRMYANQRALTPPGLAQSAMALGLDVPSFEKCVASEPPKKKVRQDLADAAVLNANATPSFFFGVEEKGGKVKVVQRMTGAKTFAAFQAALDALLSSPAPKN